MSTEPERALFSFCFNCLPVGNFANSVKSACKKKRTMSTLSDALSELSRTLNTLSRLAFVIDEDGDVSILIKTSKIRRGLIGGRVRSTNIGRGIYLSRM